MRPGDDDDALLCRDMVVIWNEWRAYGVRALGCAMWDLGLMCGCDERDMTCNEMESGVRN